MSLVKTTSFILFVWGYTWWCLGLLLVLCSGPWQAPGTIWDTMDGAHISHVQGKHTTHSSIALIP